MAQLIGYEAVAPAIEKRLPEVASKERPQGSQEPTFGDDVAAKPSPLEIPSIQFWRQHGHEVRADEGPPEDAEAQAALALSDLGQLPGSPPPPPPLAPWPVLVPKLRAAMSERVDTGALDVDGIVRRLSRGEPLHDFPRIRRRRWGSEAQVIEDRAQRLVPFWSDQDQVTPRLSRLFPRHAFSHARIFDGHERPLVFGGQAEFLDYERPPPGTVVIVLGDLGCFSASKARQRFWLEFGMWLRAGRCRPVAVVPAARSRWPRPLDDVWHRIEWETAAPPVGPGGEGLSERAERLLALVSPAVRIEPGLLRAVRLCLKATEADAGTEADVWAHPALASRHPVAATLDPDEANRLRQAFEQESESIRQAVLKAIRAWRAGLPKEIWYDEIVNLEPESQDLLDQGERQEARRFFQSLAFVDIGGTPPPPGFIRWGLRVSRRQSDAARADAVLRAHLDGFFRFVSRFDPEVVLPKGYDPMAAPKGPGTQRTLTLRQDADSIAVTVGLPEGTTTESSQSLLGVITESSGEVLVEPFETFWNSGAPPSWASDWDQDQYGPWVEFAIDGSGGEPIIQRLRWCPPGTFTMGSPEDEPGRYEDEGPRHVVAIGAGFWMFETPVTQALWAAVMGDNPSHFKSPDRPIEQVSWDDARTFIERLNLRLPGLDLRLPSEAEWEYACRAGTETALWTGPIEILGERNAPALDPIAWYGGNSGVGFDLDEFEDSSIWHEKQHDHSRAGTRRVGLKEVNPWGLSDMLGNVWEWCEDHWHDSYQGAPADGRAWLHADAGAGANRVFRGGSWFDFARRVRSAFRYHLAPGGRDDYLGFRCARVQDGAEPRAGVRDSERSPAGRGESAKAERPTAAGRPGGAVLRRVGDDGEATLPIPQAPAFIIATDCERLTFGRITRPEWARAIGRDRFGLWAEIEVRPERPAAGIRPARQRLRWIPPGRFTMGSPEDEPARWDAEGPQHKVTIAAGYWLFDTAVTQALWQAVTGENPSRFKTPDRPVEQVSWVDATEFLTMINARFDSLDLVLPSEAQWEYACRAGTDTALYSGPIEILGDANAPALDPIAWYGGNSGVDFELEEGSELSYLSDRQYRRDKSGSHPVRRKAPNAWGLYDMLGNVFEWCADHWHNDYDGAPADGRAWLEADAKAGADRVIRGGSWYGLAGGVRSAYRTPLAPDVRDDSLGFRCARVQEGAEPPAERSTDGRGAAAKAERPTDPDRPGGAKPRTHRRKKTGT